VKTITVTCPNPGCGWFAHVPAEFDDGPSFLAAREAAGRAAAAHECGVAAESAGSGVTPAAEVVRMVPIGKPRAKAASTRRG